MSVKLNFLLSFHLLHTGCSFCHVSAYGSVHGISRRMQAVCASYLPRSIVRISLAAIKLEMDLLLILVGR